jgi:hypothetical protein
VKKKNWGKFCEEITEFIVLFGTLAVVIMYVVCAVILVGIEIFG